MTEANKHACMHKEKGHDYILCLEEGWNLITRRVDLSRDGKLSTKDLYFLL